MLLYATLYRRHPAFFVSLSANHALQSILIIKCLLWLCISSLFFIAAANAQDATPQAISTELSSLSETELLTQARSLRNTDREVSARLAAEALHLSTGKNNKRVSAQAHSFLAEVAQQSNKIDESLLHYLQASLIYKHMNDKRNQIMSSLDYANVFFDEKRYDEVHKTINELLPIALKYGDELPIALSLIVDGDSYYQQKRYDDAVTQYTRALKYLSSEDDIIQRRLAETSKKIAQSYKRLRNREQTVAFYRKTLHIYTALQDRKLMARTLTTLAEAERYVGDYLIALDYSIRALEIQREIDDPEGLAKALMGAGIIYRYIGRYENSLKHIHEAYLFYEKEEDASGIAKTSNQMGLIYTRLKQFEQARSFYQRTIDLPEKSVEPETLASALREMAVINLNFGDYEPAKEVAQKAHEIYKNVNDKSKASVTARIIGNVYRAQKNDDQAIAYYRESLSLATDIGSKLYQVKAQTPLATSLIGKNTEEAIGLLTKALEISTKINEKSQRLYVYRALRQAEKSRNNIAKALHYAEEEIALTKVIQKERDDNNLVREKANLYSHKMEMELESLREKTKLDQLELARKNSEIEIAEQANRISELELTKNRYSSVALASLLVICLLAVIFMYRMFTDSKKRNKELDYLATRDPLTNCYNRRILFDLMNRDFSELDRLDEYSIMMIDIDHFKAVNDTYGHNVGDTVIRGVANILQGGVRKNDITARFGGEEFCVVLPGATEDQAMSLAETLRKKIETSHFDNVTVTCSFGVTSIKYNAKAPAELIDQADLALYQSKSHGRNQVTLWDSALEEEV